MKKEGNENVIKDERDDDVVESNLPRNMGGPAQPSSRHNDQRHGRKGNVVENGASEVASERERQPGVEVKGC